MNDLTKLGALTSNLSESIAFFKKRAKQNKSRAYFIKVFSVTCAALITFFLGIKDINVTVFSTLALFTAVLLTIVNGIENFFNHQALWIKDAETLSQLRLLKNELEFHVIEQNYSDEIIESYHAKFNEIIKTDFNNWLHLKSNQLKSSDDKDRNN